MKPTEFQQTVLQIYWSYHTGGWRLGPFLRVNWWRWLLLMILAVVAGWFVFEFDSSGAGIVFGLCAGAFIRDLGRLIQSYRVWPVFEEVTNWQRVEELIQSRTHDDLTEPN